MNRILPKSILALLALLALSACGGGAGSTGFTPGYQIGGSLTGLIAGRTLVLQNNGGNNLTLTANGPFAFSTWIAPNTAYSVTILTPPAGENCVLANNVGTATAIVTNISVTCTPQPFPVSGTITGLTAGGLTLLNNLADSVSPLSGATTFAFATQIVSGNPYSVTVSVQPAGLTCSVTNASGTVVTAVTNVAVSCVAPCTACTVGGTLTGLQAGQSITFQNGADSFTKTDVAGNGAFTFPTGLASGTAYSVSITTSPTNQPCSVTYGAGTVTNTSISNVNVFCGYPLRGNFSSAISMLETRADHTATVLQDGRVLVVGGAMDVAGVTTALATTRLYNTDGTWSSGASLTTARYQHTATLLADGRVLVVGGTADGTTALATAQIYTPAAGAAGSWATETALGAVARYGHTATLLASGKVLVVGGNNGGVLNSAYVYNPTDASWTITTTNPSARIRHTATLLNDGTNRVLVVGGWNTTGYLSSVEYYDPAVGANGSWTADTPLAVARQQHTATLLPSGKVLVAGGFNGSVVVGTADIYTPGATTGTWVATGSLAARTLHTATLLANGKVLAAGGCSDISCGPTTLATAEYFDPATGSWATAGSLAETRSRYAAVLLTTGTNAGKVLVSGGNSGTAILATAELYDPASISMTTTGTLTARYRHTATRLSGGTVLAAGGLSGTTTLASSEYYDPALGTWTATTGNLATPRYDHASVVLTTGPNAGKVLAIGGVNGTAAQNSVEMYDPGGKTWSPAASLNTARYQHTATVLFDGRILVAGGTDGISTLTSAEIYDPAATTPTWAYVGSLTAGRYQHTATLLHGGKVLVTGGASGGTALNSAEVFDPVPTTGGVYAWTTVTGTTPGARTRHTATLLPSGKVLVAGGLNDLGATVTTAALYDPAGTWTATGSLTGARSLHTATLLPSGKVLVTGGLDTAALATAELYDPAGVGTWASSGALVAARYQHAATLLENGKLLVTGGYNGTTLGTAELGW